MAHYAFLDENNIVTEVIMGIDEGVDGIDWEVHYGNFRGQTCKRTSYNTRGGIHLEGKTPYRKNYACIGFTYDEKRDAFIPPQPYASWILNESTADWQPPIPRPSNEETETEFIYYEWNEENLNWDQIIIKK